MRLVPEANALYLRISEGKVAHTVEIEDSVRVDLDDHDRALGVEFLDATRFVPSMSASPSLQERVTRSLANHSSAAD